MKNLKYNAMVIMGLVACLMFVHSCGSSGGGAGGGDDGGVTAACGDGIVAASESCDDGNTLNGDCCSSTCQFETAGTSCDDLICSNGDAKGTCTSSGECIGAPVSFSGRCIAFLTSGSYYGDFGGLAGADAICQRLAREENLPGTFKAWLSDSTTNAADRLSHSVVPYALVNGAVVASNWQDLTDGSGLNRAISMSEGGYDWYGVCAQCFWLPGGCGSVWTATAPDGTQERGTCDDWTGQGNFGGTGIYCLESDTSWTRYPAFNTSVDCYHSRSLYCLQQ